MRGVIIPKRFRDLAPARSLFLRVARPLLHRWFLVSRGLTLGVRGVVVDERGRVCLVRHGYAPGWQLPGGGVEVGETAEEALARELREETGVVLVGRPRLHGIVQNRHASRRDHVLLYEVLSFEKGAPPPRSSEIAEAGFFPVDELPPETTAGTRARIAEIRGGTASPLRWTDRAQP